MSELLVRGIVWHGAELVIQETERPNGSSVFGFPGAIVLPGETPVNVLKADLSRKLGFDFSELYLGDEHPVKDDYFDARFFETRLPYNSVTRRKNFHLWYMDQVKKALENDQLTSLSAKYIKKEFIDGVIDY
jgi:hypothetical protein